MKRSLAAVLAVLSVLCTFTACGNEAMENSESSSVSESSESSESSADKDEDSEDSEEESSESEVETTTLEKKESDGTLEKKTEDETAEAVAAAKAKLKEKQKEISDKIEEAKEITGGASGVASPNEYADIMAKFCNATADGDGEAMLKYCLPDSSYEAIKSMGALESMIEEAGIDDFGMPVNVDADDIKVVSIRGAEKEEIEQSEMAYSFIDVTYGMMADAGVTYDMLMGETEMPDDVFEAYIESFSQIDFESPEDIPITVEFDEYVFVTYSFGGIEEEIAVYKVKGESGLKLDSIYAAGGFDFDDVF